MPPHYGVVVVMPVGPKETLDTIQDSIEAICHFTDTASVAFSYRYHEIQGKTRWTALPQPWRLLFRWGQPAILPSLGTHSRASSLIPLSRTGFTWGAMSRSENPPKLLVPG